MVTAASSTDKDAAVVDVIVVHCWSAPRSRSTALLYSFEARGSGDAGSANGSGVERADADTADTDTAVLDEPLYRRDLLERPHLSRPYRSRLTAPSRAAFGLSPSSAEGEGDEEWRYERERRGMQARVDEAVRALVVRRRERERARQEGGGAASAAVGEKQEGQSAVAAGPAVVFVKHMAKHGPLYNFSTEQERGAAAPEEPEEEMAAAVAVRHRHVLLLRDPVAVCASWDRAARVGGAHGSSSTASTASTASGGGASHTLEEVGIAPLLSIYTSLTSRPNDSLPPVILDSDDLASGNARGTLQALCRSLEIGYTDRMLRWHAGVHECDGPWAAWWYGDARKSTGWPSSGGVGGAGPASRSSYSTLDPRYLPLLRGSVPVYAFLKGEALRPDDAADASGPSEIQYEDPRNADLLVHVGPPPSSPSHKPRLVHRSQAGLSPFDSAVQGGDAVWEGLRVYRGKVLCLDRHLDRLFRSARACGFGLFRDVDGGGSGSGGDGTADGINRVHTQAEVKDALFATLAANGMRDGAHVRLTLTRGEKYTSSMNPQFNVYGTTLVVLAEWKAAAAGPTTYDNDKGISLITASNRRHPPSTLDSKIHHNNLLNNILPKIQANLAGAADAVMLDVEGYVSETNATNLFMVDGQGTLLTPTADHCLPGITRENVLILARELGIPTCERRVSLAEFHSAQEAFTTGTMGELTPVNSIDGRRIGSGDGAGPVTRRLQDAYRALPEREGWSMPIPPFS